MSNQTSIQKPSKVTRSQERLQAAVQRLESAVAGQVPVAAAVAVGSQDNSQLLALQEEARQLRQENSALKQENSALKQESSALKQVHDQVSSRLDATIERLGVTLGE